jgi:hypothetical protein
MNCPVRDSGPGSFAFHEVSTEIHGNRLPFYCQVTRITGNEKHAAVRPPDADSADSASPKIHRFIAFQKFSLANTAARVKEPNS